MTNTLTDEQMVAALNRGFHGKRKNTEALLEELDELLAQAGLSEELSGQLMQIAYRLADR